MAAIGSINIILCFNVLGDLANFHLRSVHYKIQFQKVVFKVNFKRTNGGCIQAHKKKQLLASMETKPIGSWQSVSELAYKHRLNNFEYNLQINL